jgi:hypothetical protein
MACAHCFAQVNPDYFLMRIAFPAMNPFANARSDTIAER